MPVPTRPVTGASIASEWGQWVHDFAFAPAGCKVTGGQVSQAASPGSVIILPLDTAVDDPGGYADLANNRLVIPPDGDGIYHVIGKVAANDGGTDIGRAWLYINGAESSVSPIATYDGGVTIITTILDVVELVEGDLLTIRSKQYGSGARADVWVSSLMILRVGAEFGAPTP